MTSEEYLQWVNRLSKDQIKRLEKLDEGWQFYYGSAPTYDELYEKFYEKYAHLRLVSGKKEEEKQ